MKHFPRRARRVPRIEIIPMVDVMFLLLVFYILSSLAMGVQRGIPVQLPQASTGQRDRTPDEVVVTIDAKGTFFLNKKQVDPDKLGQAVTELAATYPGGLPALRQGSVTLNADMSVEHRRVVQAMNNLREIGIDSFSIATEPDKAAAPPQGS